MFDSMHSGAASARLEIDSLSKRYGETVALDHLSFDVRAGEIFGFVGSNGAGKTTAMRIILGVLAADAGHVPRDVLEPAVEYLLFTLPKKELCPEPIDTPRGYWIVRRND